MAGSILPELLYPTRCAFCGARESSGVCTDCAARLPRLARTLRESPELGHYTAPVAYRDMAREAVHRLKFGRNPSAAAGLGRLLAECAAELPAFDAITWVPVSKQRRRKRGYDQAELLARAAGRLLGVKPCVLLVKMRDNPPQSGQDDEKRRENVRGAYRALPAAEGRRVLLIDDVITTGATLAECRRALLGAGAASVDCACFAAAVLPAVRHR